MSILAGVLLFVISYTMKLLLLRQESVVAASELVLHYLTADRLKEKCQDR